MARIRVDLPDRFPFSTELAVRVGDINYGGHLGNDALLALLQESRMQFLQQYGYTERDIGGKGIIMVDAAIQYRAESFHGNLLVIEVAVTEIDKRGCDFVYRVTNKATGKEVARAKTGIVFFDYAQRAMVPVPPEFATVVSAGGASGGTAHS